MFYFEKNFGLFVGKLTVNEFHRHYAIQLSICSKSELKLTMIGEEEKSDHVFYIAAKTDHKLLSAVNQMTILINPLSTIGHQLHLKFGNSPMPKLSNDFTAQLINSFTQFETNIMIFNELCSIVAAALDQFKCTCDNENHSNEDRIVEAIQFMDRNFERVISLGEMAERCHLSPSRFIHLFKEKTGLNFRRYLLWNKLVKSLPYLTTHSITDTAHTFNFSDSSHYTRTFKETFGVNPKFMFGKE